MHAITIKDFPCHISVDKAKYHLFNVFTKLFPNRVIAANVIGRYNHLYRLVLELKSSKEKYHHYKRVNREEGIISKIKKK